MEQDDSGQATGSTVHPAGNCRGSSVFSEQLTTHASLSSQSHAAGSQTLIVKFNFFSMADNYGIEQLILHNHMT